MADERNSNPDKNAGRDAEDAETRAQLDALKVEEEREALKKAREHQDSAASSEENDGGLGNLHYGDEAQGDYLKDAGGTEGGDYSSDLNHDNTAATPVARSGAGAGETIAPPVAAPEGRVPNDNGNGDGSPLEPSDGGRGSGLLAGDLDETGAGLRFAQAETGGQSQDGPSGAQNGAEEAGGSVQPDTLADDELFRGPVNDAPTDIILSNDTVFENEEGAVVLSLSATDPDPNDTVSFSIAEDASGFFEIVGDELRLKEGVALDYEAQNTFQLTIVATDEAGAVYEETVTINVADVNDAPEGLALSNNTIAENDAGVVVGDLSVTDQDAGDTHEFVVSDNRFEVVDGQLKLKDGVSLDHETADSVSVTVTATDTGGLQTAATFDITVGDVNEAPEGLALSNNSIVENEPGAVVGDLSLTDVDDGDAHEFAVSDNRFEVVDGQLKLKDGVSLDHEAAESVSVTVTATDSGGLQTEATFDIAVGDVNEAPEGLALSNNAIAENDPGAVVGDLSLTDQDDDETHEFVVSDNRFEVVDGQLKLKDGVSLDHETEDSVSVTVTATDSGGLQTGTTFDIAVGDVNETPTDLDLSNNIIDENDAGAVVGVLSSADPDDGDSATYVLVDDPSGLFEVVDDQLKLKDGVSLDHEAQDSYDVVIRVVDGEGLSRDEAFTINVADVNEAPTDIQFNADSESLLVDGSFELPDVNSGGWRGFGSDPSGLWDSANGVEVWDNLFGTPAAEGEQFLELDYTNALDSISQTVDTVEGKVYDISFDAKARSAGGGTDTIEVYWNGEKVGEVDPTSTSWETSTFQVIGTGGDDVLEFREAGDENDSLGAHLDNVSLTESVDGVAENVEGVVVATLTSSDPDAGDTATYSIADDPSGLFEVVGDQLKLKDGVSLDHEAQDSHDVVVRVTDSGGLTHEETVTINVADVNEAPEGLALSNNAIAENDPGAVVGDLSLTDVDDGDAHEFVVSDSRFEVVDSQLKLKDGVSLDHEADESVSVTVTATDSGGLQTAATFDIAVGDVNEAPTNIDLSNDTVSENTPGAIVGDLSSSDPDEGDSASYAIAEDPSGLFEVVNGQLKLKDGVALDHEAQDSYELTLEVTDGSGAIYLESFTINVADVNEAPTDIIADGVAVSTRENIDVSDGVITTGQGGGQGTAALVLPEGAEARIVIDFARVDNSLELEVNGESLTGNVIQLQRNVFDQNTESFLQFEDGAAIDRPWVPTQDGGPRIQAVITEDGVQFFATRTSSSTTLEPLVLTNGSFTAPDLVDGVNTVTVINPDSSGPDGLSAVVRADYEATAYSVSENVDGAVVATLMSSDPDEGDTAAYSIADDPSGLFEVVGDQLKVKDGASLDHEGQDAYEVVVRVTDSGGLTYEETVRIQVEDANEAPTDLDISNDTVAENDAGATVATLTSSDPDDGDSAAYALADDPSGLFEVVGDQLRLKPGVSLDHEAQDSYDLTLEVTDGSGASHQETVTINVADVNEAPINVALAPAVSEPYLSLNQGGGRDDLAIASDIEGFPADAITVEVTFASSQTNVGSGVPLFSYAADDGHNNEALIWLESSSGNVAIFLGGQRFLTDIPNASLLDGEQHQVSFTWDQASDELKVYVDGQEEFSTTVNARDLRADGTVTLGQEQDTEGGRFDPGQVFEGEIAEVRIFNEARSAQEIADNADGPLADPQNEPGLVVNWRMNEETGGVVEDLAGDNDLVLQNGASIEGGEAVYDVPTVEENDAGAVVGTLSASDPDEGDSVSYAIADDPSGLFEVVGDQLKLKDGVSVDHEAQDSYELTVAAIDEAGLSTEHTVTVSVADLNEAPLDIALSNDTVAENDAGAVVATLTSSDPDEGDSATYALADDPSGLFEVVGDQLKLKDGVALDHEGQDSYELTLEVTDGAGASHQETVTINVADVNEAPIDIEFGTPGEGVFLEQGGQLVIEAENFDANNPGNNDHAWGDSTFDGAVHVDDGATFNNMWRTQADVEANAPELTYQVQFDTPGEYYVHVRGAAEDGPRGNADSVHIGLNGERLTGDGGLTGFGEDLSWGARDTFTGQRVTITVDAPGTYELNLWAREDGVAVDKIVLTQDPDYTPSGEGPAESPRVGGSGALPENAADGTVVATLTAVDPDAGDTHTFEIVDSDGNPVVDDNFEIVGNEIRVKAGADLDFETDASPELFVKTTDAGGESYIEAVEINLEDVNEAPTDIALSNDTISEGDAGAVVATLTSSDPDAGDTASYAIAGDPSGAFEIVGDQLKLKDGVSLDHADGAEREVTIEVTDSAGNAYQETVTINVEDANTAPELSIASGANGLEASYFDIGTSIRNLSEVDFDAAPDATGVVESLNYTTGNQAFWDGGPDNFFAAKYEGQLVVQEGGSYTIDMASDDGSMLFIDGQPVLDNDGLHGTRTRSVTLDLDAGSHDIEVRYFENGGRQTLQLNWSGPDTGGATELIGGDAFQHGVGADGLSLPEDTPGAVVAALAVSDPDAGDTHTFDVSDDRFEVVDVDGAPTLKLKDDASIDHETEGSVNVTVTVTDAAGESDMADFTIAVEDTNAAPTIGPAEASGLQASYYDVGGSISRLSDIDFNGAPDATGVVDSLNYTTGNQAFWEGGPDNYFAARYEGDLIVEEGGSYTINLASDDGSQLFIDGQPVIDNDGLHSTSTQSVTLDLDPGAHAIEIRYFENTGAQTLQLSWSGPDTGGATEIVQGAALQQPGTFGVDANVVTENDPGAVAALLAAADPDGDPLVFAVSDDRFEVTDTDAGPALKLKDGVSLDFETDPQVTVTVTATDPYGESASADFTIDVADIDDGPAPLAGATPGADRLNGTNDADYIDGLAGNDRLDGRNGEDTILGGEGDDRINGGNDNDTLIGGEGDDTMNGGNGDDTFIVSGADQGFDRFNGGRGNDAIIAGEDGTVIGVSRFGNNVETISADGHDGVTIAGDAANNTLNFSRTALDGIEAIDGGAGNDRISGSTGDDVIIGGAGDDRLSGGGGNDTFLVTGTDDGFDRISGGGGQDAIVAGADNTQIGLSAFSNSVETISADGHDGVTIQGTAGNNTFSFSKTSLDGVEAIDGGAGNDRITGSAGDDTILGGEGRDDLRGGDGADRLEGGDDNDRLRGQDGDDTMLGGAGDDRLEGGAGADVMIGGLGDDTMLGGAGDDVFVYADGDGSDVVRAGGGDWTDVIQFDGGIEALGEFGVDWTVELTRGSIDSVDADRIDLSQNADGVITLNDGSTIQFQDVEQII